MHPIRNNILQVPLDCYEKYKLIGPSVDMKLFRLKEQFEDDEAPPTTETRDKK